MLLEKFHFNCFTLALGVIKSNQNNISDPKNLMTRSYISVLFLCSLLLICFTGGFAQEAGFSNVQSQEISEVEGIPVLIKHLPDWENKKDSAVLVKNSDDLRNVLGNRRIFNGIEFTQGIEAVTAPYNQGKLLIIEYNTPQSSAAADDLIRKNLDDSSETIFYRRIGNYNVLLLDAKDETTANALLDQVKYEKVVQWLGTNHTLFRRKERAFIEGTSDLFLSTVMLIVSIFGIAIIFGLIIGMIYFFRRDKRFAAMDQFSDAGGMTRLNLDGYTPDIISGKLLDK